MDKVVLWIRRSLTVVVVLLFLVWAAIQWGAEVNAANFATGIFLDEDETAAVQARWLCAAAAGPECLLMDRLGGLDLAE